MERENSSVAGSVAALEGLTRYEPSDGGMFTNNVSGEYVEYREVMLLFAAAGSASPAAAGLSDAVQFLRNVIADAAPMLRTSNFTKTADLLEGAAKDIEREVLAHAGVGAQPPVEMARFCPHCGSVGDVEARYRDCCPDGSDARSIPRKLAEQCRELFKAALNSAAAPSSDDVRNAALEEAAKVCETEIVLTTDVRKAGRALASVIRALALKPEARK